MTILKLICPDCGDVTLVIGLSLELPPDARSDDIILQLIECPKCGFHGIGVYEESRRGALDSESWRHWGYRATPQVLDSLRHSIELCRNSSNRNCKCPSHLALGIQNSAGYWAGLEANDIDTKNAFPIRVAETPDRK